MKLSQEAMKLSALIIRKHGLSKNEALQLAWTIVRLRREMKNCLAQSETENLKT